MPYVSDAQRRWAHTQSAKKAGFPTAEYDKASKGMKLPERSRLSERLKSRARRKMKK